MIDTERRRDLLVEQIIDAQEAESERWKTYAAAYMLFIVAAPHVFVWVLAWLDTL